MNHLPAPRSSVSLTQPTRHEAFSDEEGDRREEVWQVFLRNRLLICFCLAVGILAAGAFAWRSDPVYVATASLRIENKTPDLPGVFRLLSKGGEVVTEIEMLRSRTLAEDAVTMLGLQVGIERPRGLPRDSVFAKLEVDPKAAGAQYQLVRQADGRFQVRKGETGVPVGVVAPGERLDIGDLAFTLAEGIRSQPLVTVTVAPFDQTVAAIAAGVSVSQAARDAGVVLISYSSSDPKIASGVPNIITTQYLARRQDAQKSEARSTVNFLRNQLDTLAVQLRDSEDELRRFREQERVVHPAIEAEGQVRRLIEQQSQRATLEAERAALAQVLSEAQKPSAADSRGGSYRRLMAFPSLLRDRAATELLASLAAVEDERSALLTRRTEQDPDVITLTNRAADLENQLRQFAATYLQGLTSQIHSLDGELSQFSQRLTDVPRRELDFARLERKPKLLEEVYTMLQTRMKEAQIAAAVEDPSVRIVDAAVTPTAPAGPRRAFFLVGGAFGGLLLGVSMAFAREYRDHMVRTRRDVRVATGLPVMGLIPRLPRNGRKHAIIAQKIKQGELSRSPQHPPAGGADTTRPRGSFTFLGDQTRAPTVEPRPLGPAVVTSWQELKVYLPPPGTLTAEAYGILQTNIAFSRSDAEVKAVVFTSALPGEGKTTTAINFALTVTQRGLRVLLVDADVAGARCIPCWAHPRPPD